MRVRAASAVASLVLLCACRTAGRPRELLPLAAEGEVLIYVQPLPAEAEQLEFTVASVSALGSDGEARPLETIHGKVTSSPPPRQRLLARGRLPPGTYSSLLVNIGRATLRRGGDERDLLVAAEPTRIDAGFTVRMGEATVLWATLRPRESLSSRYGFTPALGVAPPPPAVPDLVGYCTNTGTHDVTVFDRVRRQVLAVIATGPGPRGIVLDALAGRAFVATHGAGEVQVIDVAQGRIIGQITLDPGDAPTDVVLTPDRHTLLSVNQRTNSASFLDPDAWVQRSRVQTGDLPTKIIEDRSGKRAYVLDSTSNDITVLDLAYGSVVGRFKTESEPVAAALDRDGAVLYVALRGSPYVSALSATDFAPLSRVFVGGGASSVIVDPRTNRLYVGAGRSGIQVFEPAGFTPVGLIEVPEVVSDMIILEAEHVMLALMPAERAVAAIDLTSSKVLSLFDVGDAPFELAVSGARR